MDLLELGISLILTIFVYLIFPICYRYGNGKVCEKDAKKMALWNSIICAAIFCVIRGIISGGETVVTSFAPAFLYYFIAKSILVDYNMKETIKEKNKKELEQSDDAYICSKCGMQVFSDEEKCSNCGATNIHFNKSCNGKENDNAKIVPEEIVEEEVVIANDNNTKLSNNKSNSNRINIIKNLQKAVTIVACVLVLFAIIYPISTTAIKNGKIPNYNEYKTTQLTRLDANQKVYCEMSNNYNYLYIKDGGNIVVYRFANYTMYTNSNGVRSGYATSSQLKNYFTSNIYSGKPSLSYVLPAASAIGWTIGVLMVIAIGILMYLIHRYSEEELFNLSKSNDTFIKIKDDYKNDMISKYDYSKLLKTKFSEEILNNNKFFKIFTFLY